MVGHLDADRPGVQATACRRTRPARAARRSRARHKPGLQPGLQHAGSSGAPVGVRGQFPGVRLMVLCCIPLIFLFKRVQAR